MQQVAEVARQAAREGLERVELRVHWEEAGVSRVTVQVQSGKVRVELHCVSPEHMAALRTLEAPLRERLETQGLQLQDFRADAGGGQAGGHWAGRDASPLRGQETPSVPGPGGRPEPQQSARGSAPGLLPDRGASIDVLV